ncbi:hypothetical protein GCM10023219_07740 [Stakelama sediminis]|uniref:Heme oxygenase n=1 Tax=Stakelama sediminis TaxID=463200 RepID=A0A840YVB9_9SPHN|nr:hypothetical protein [Stakelama sediminis]MBB5717495.1 heme oxygenase [Stakelama sediminis]
MPDYLPRHYLNPNQEAEKWPVLLETLDTILYDAGQLEIAIAAARRVFEYFAHFGEHWLTKE